MYILMLISLFSVSQAQTVRNGDLLLGGGLNAQASDGTVSLSGDVHKLLSNNFSLGGGLFYSKTNDADEVGVLVVQGSYFFPIRGPFTPVLSAGFGGLAADGYVYPTVSVSAGIDCWLDKRVSLRPEITQLVVADITLEPILNIGLIVRFPLADFSETTPIRRSRQHVPE